MKRIPHLTLALLALASAAAFAQDAGDTPDKRWAVVGGYALSEPTGDSTLAGERAELDGEGAATVSASYYVTDNIAVEAWGAADKFGHRVNTADGKVASVDAQPYAVSGQYHFGTRGQTVRPFVGLGYYEANYDGESAEASGPLAGQRIGVETANGAMATAGVDVELSPSWFARADVRYLHGDSDVMVDGETVGEADVSPVVVGVGLGARF
jgi:outer membrane protein